MNYLVIVRNLFNDMFIFFNGKEAIGLETLQDVYQEEPLFLAFISDLPEALKVPYNDVMKECYDFYKQYCSRELTEDDWDHIVAGIQEFNSKWKNAWCRKLILALLELLEREEKERKADAEGETPEGHAKEQQMPNAA